MSDDKHKNIPTLDDIVKPGTLEKAVTGDADDRQEEKRTTNRRAADRRVSKKALADEKIERRIEDRRKKQRRADDKKNSTEKSKECEPGPDRRGTDLRSADRRDPDRPKPDGIVDTRGGERRQQQRRITDVMDLDSLVEVIMNDMPDLEQHMRVQLRFELERYLPKYIARDDKKDD